LHFILHFVVPALFVTLFFRADWKRAYILMVLTMLVDMDHLLAIPIYDPGRCSIGFHPLHTYLPILIYAALCFAKRFRYIGIGLVIHMALDSLDCQITNGIWTT
jgi:hypothetical protein